MALDASAWQAALLAAFNGITYNGPDLPKFCQAIASGSVTHIVGKAFVTVDVGTVPGTGAGLGTGVTGIGQSLVSSTIFSTASGFFGQSGPALQPTCNVIASVLVAQMANARLVSVDSPVFLGAGTITPGTIAVVGSAWGAAIQAAAPTFVGPQWPNFALAIGMGCAAGFSTATGNLVITGSPSGIPSPGGGAGSGTIS